MNKLLKSVLYTTTALGLCHAANMPAFAQQTAAAEVEEIVVTGTLIRGIAPVGSNVIGITREDIQASGVNDSNQLLAALVPQSNFFMDLQQPANGVSAGVGRVSIDRPQLRNVGNPFNNSGSTTLVMMDGHRIVTSGLEQAGVDTGIIPPGMIERQEIILDGVSAVYGSDAVAGVINYITRKRFDGTQASATYSFADSYDAVSVNATTGKTWDGGGLGVTYSFGENSALLNKDREYTAPRNYFENRRLTGLNCEGYAHVTIGAAATLRRFTTTPGQNAFTEQTAYCATNPYSTFTPSQERHAGFMTFSQDLSDTIKFDMSAFYSTRKTRQIFGPFTATQTIRPTNPYYRTIPGVANAAQASQSVAFTYGPVLGNDSSNAVLTLDMWQVSPTLTVDLGEWQARGTFAYGHSINTLHQATLDTTAQGIMQNGTTLATTINPYDVAASQNIAAIRALVYDAQKDAIQELYQAKVTADGPLFAIPGGDVRLAVGGEWTKTTFSRRNTDVATHALSGFLSAASSEWALFTEVNAPIVGPQNSRPGIQSLTLSISGRYDKYKDYGDTFNPKIGLTYEPVEWVTLRGNWGKSFRAPNAVDKLGSTASTVRCFGQVLLNGCSFFSFDVPPGLSIPAPPAVPVYIYLSGGTAGNVKPETSNSWSFGGDIRVPFVEGLTLSGTYYGINFKDKIEILPAGFLAQYNNFRDTITVNPTQAQIDAFLALAPLNGADLKNVLTANGYTVFYLRDGRTMNLGSVKVRGLDLTARYSHQTSFGSIDASVNGTFQLKNETKASATAAPVQTILTGTSRFAMTAAVGANIGDFRAQATLQHRSGYRLDPSTTRVPDQTAIDQFDILNVSFRYNFNGNTPLLQDWTLTAAINNVLDTNPPVSRTTAGTTANGSTLGRLIQLGVSKKF